MFSFAIVAFTGCLCIAGATHWKDTPISWSTTSYGGPSAISATPYASAYSYAPQTYSSYSYTPEAYPTLPASSEMLKFSSAALPQMSYSMPWIAKLDESDKVQYMPLMAYGASYLPEQYKISAETWSNHDLKEPHHIPVPIKTYSSDLKYAPENMKLGAWSTELKQTHPVSMPVKAYSSEIHSYTPEFYKTLPVSMPLTTVTTKSQPLTTLGWTEGMYKDMVMPHKESLTMPVATSKTSFTVKHTDTPIVQYAPEYEGMKVSQYMMPIHYEKENLALPIATSKSMFTMKHNLETPASTILSPTLEGFETPKYPFTYSY